MSPVRIGVVGTGWWSTQHHLPGLLRHPDAVVTAVSDPDPGRLATAQERFGVEQGFASYADLCTSGLVDGVVVATPHSSHYDIAKAALDAGLHVMVEKPMTLRSDDAWDLVATAERNGLHLVVGYTFHFTPHTIAAQELVRSGRLGELRLVSGLFSSMVESFLRARPEDYRDVMNYPVTGPQPSTYSDPRIAGGGQGQTQVTHAMGNVLHVTGDRVTEVCALMESFDLAVDLADAMTFRLAGGAIGTMASIGSVQPGQPTQHEFRYYGSEGMLLQDLANGRLEAHFHDGSSRVWDQLAEDDVYPTHATAGCLVDLIAGNAHNHAPGSEGARVVGLLEAAYASAAAGGAPVRVPDRPKVQ